MKPAYILGNIIDWLKRRSKVTLTAAGLILVVLIGAVDRLTPAEMLFVNFYLVIILFVTWFAGRRAGVFIAVVSGITWLVVNLLQATPGWRPFIPYWNALSGLVVFLGVVFLLSTVKALASKMIRAIAAGPANTTALPVDSLSERQLEILRLLGHGHPTTKIAADLKLSVKTVEGYIARVKEKLGLATANELLQYAIKFNKAVGD